MCQSGLRSRSASLPSAPHDHSPSQTTRLTSTSRAARTNGLHKSTGRSEEHTSELQSRQYLVCRLLLEKKKPAVALPEQRLVRRIATLQDLVAGIIGARRFYGETSTPHMGREAVSSLLVMLRKRICAHE